MTLFSKKEFSAFCNIGTNELSVYLKRNKVILNENDLIDDKDQKNQAFIQKRLSRLGQKTDNIATAPTPLVKKIVDVSETLAKNFKPEQTDNSQKSFAELEMQKLIADIAKKEADLEKALLVNAKIKGEVIPFGLMKPLIAQNNQSITTEFKNAADELISNISKKKRLSGSEVADLNKLLVTVINEAIKKATDLSIKNLSIIINDYQSSIK